VCVCARARSSNTFALFDRHPRSEPTERRTEGPTGSLSRGQMGGRAFQLTAARHFRVCFTRAFVRSARVGGTQRGEIQILARASIRIQRSSQETMFDDNKRTGLVKVAIIGRLFLVSRGLSSDSGPSPRVPSSCRPFFVGHDAFVRKRRQPRVEGGVARCRANDSRKIASPPCSPPS